MAPLAPLWIRPWQPSLHCAYYSSVNFHSPSYVLYCVRCSTVAVCQLFKGQIPLGPVPRNFKCYEEVTS